MRYGICNEKRCIEIGGNETMKKYIAAFLGLVLVTSLIGIMKIRPIKDCGISSAETIQDVNKLKCYYEPNDTEEKLKYDKKKLENGCEQLYADYDSADHIAIVVPTGKVKLYRIDLVQEVEVLEVKKGAGELKGQKIMLEDAGSGFQLRNKAKIPDCHSVQNIMQENTKYLCFFDDIPLNQENHVEQYVLTNILSFFNLEHTNHTTLLSEERTKYTFGDLADIEFFSSSQEQLDVNNTIKEKIIERYCQ